MRLTVAGEATARSITSNNIFISTCHALRFFTRLREGRRGGVGVRRAKAFETHGFCCRRVFLIDDIVAVSLVPRARLPSSPRGTRSVFGVIFRPRSVTRRLFSRVLVTSFASLWDVVPSAGHTATKAYRPCATLEREREKHRLHLIYPP